MLTAASWLLSQAWVKWQATCPSAVTQNGLFLSQSVEIQGLEDHDFSRDHRAHRNMWAMLLALKQIP